MNGIVYCSKALVGFSKQDLETLYSRAAEVNATHNVTGYLYYSGSKFVQYLEGETGALSEVMARIRNDDRHEIVHECCQENIEGPRFPKWSMRWVRESDFVTLGMEDLIAGNLKGSGSLPQENAYYLGQLWRQVDMLATLQDKLY